ncbi:TlpA disulfide reductase family protein [Pelomonas sp. SE-A7]|uniref:TlpA disulfide reductase family protein n=1 Tax=Pelomonas sp. SE-A7 TaxID=3054953 RepID=UPI00259CE4E9|nr:TlpA disulfide reductase family protein [Pelomonas sp. SE-A7]MDM4767645.1 TlpA disulfide reductase family protein [Pelomonas sp. SE-A7]
MSSPESGPGRRKLVIGVGLAAAAAGIAVAWRQQAKPAQPDPALEAFWSSSFDQPGGGKLALAGLRGQPVLVNFWATWCPPCVKELPELDRFHQAWGPKGWRVVGLAIDQVEAVQKFLAKLPLGFDLGVTGLTGAELARTLGNPSGGLPFSVAFGTDGRVFWRKLGPTTLEELANMASSKA